MSSNDIIEDIVDLEGELPISVRKKIYKTAKYVAPALGVIGILLTALTAHYNADVSAYVLGAFSVLSGVVFAVADNHTDPAMAAKTKHPDAPVQDPAYVAPAPAPSSPTDQSTAGGTSGSNLGGTQPPQAGSSDDGTPA